MSLEAQQIGPEPARNIPPSAPPIDTYNPKLGPSEYGETFGSTSQINEPTQMGDGATTTSDSDRLNETRQQIASVPTPAPSETLAPGLSFANKLNQIGFPEKLQEALSSEIISMPGILTEPNKFNEKEFIKGLYKLRDELKTKSKSEGVKFNPDGKRKFFNRFRNIFRKDPTEYDTFVELDKYLKSKTQRDEAEFEKSVKKERRLYGGRLFGFVNPMGEKDRTTFDDIVTAYINDQEQGVLDFIENNPERMTDRLKAFLGDDWLDEIKTNLQKRKEGKLLPARQAQKKEKTATLLPTAPGSTSDGGRSTTNQPTSPPDLPPSPPAPIKPGAEISNQDKTRELVPEGAEDAEKAREEASEKIKEIIFKKNPDVNWSDELLAQIMTQWVKMHGGDDPNVAIQNFFKDINEEKILKAYAEQKTETVSPPEPPTKQPEANETVTPPPPAQPDNFNEALTKKREGEEQVQLKLKELVEKYELSPIKDEHLNELTGLFYQKPNLLESKEGINKYCDFLEEKNEKLKKRIKEIAEILKAKGVYWRDESMHESDRYILHRIYEKLQKRVDKGEDENIFNNEQEIIQIYEQIFDLKYYGSSSAYDKPLEDEGTLDSGLINREETYVVGDLSKDGFKIIHNNEKKGDDAFAVSADRKTFVLCDGMGSYNKSGALAKLIARKLAEVDTDLKLFLTEDGKEKLKTFLSEIAKSALYHTGSEETEKEILCATTLTMVRKLDNGDWMYVAIGDSALYAKETDGTIKHFGEDSAGKKESASAFTIKNNNKVVLFYGDEIQIGTIGPKQGTQLCLCSDFFTDNFTENRYNFLQQKVFEKDWKFDPMVFADYDEKRFNEILQGRGIIKPDDATFIMIDCDELEKVPKK